MGLGVFRFKTITHNFFANFNPTERVKRNSSDGHDAPFPEEGGIRSCLSDANGLPANIQKGAIEITISPYASMLFCDVASKKEKRHSSISKNQMFRSMIALPMANQLKFDYVLSDNWSGQKNIEFIHYDMKKKFVIGMKANRLIALSVEEKKNGQYQNLNTLPLKDGENRIVLRNRLQRSIALKRIIFLTSIIAYSKLEFLKRKTSLNHFALKYQLLIAANRKTFLELE